MDLLTVRIGMVSNLLNMTFVDPSPLVVNFKVLSQILVHFMKIFLKFRSIEALEVGFLSKNFWIRELRLTPIEAKMDPST